MPVTSHPRYNARHCRMHLVRLGTPLLRQQAGGLSLRCARQRPALPCACATAQTGCASLTRAARPARQPPWLPQSCRARTGCAAARSKSGACALLIHRREAISVWVSQALLQPQAWQLLPFFFAFMAVCGFSMTDYNLPWTYDSRWHHSKGMADHDKSMTSSGVAADAQGCAGVVACAQCTSRT